MGIFDGILGGQSGLTHTTTTTNTTTPANLQAGQFIAINPQALQNMATVQHNNPHTWSQTAQGVYETYQETQKLKKEVDELRYILQRTVANYDELLEQHKALQDIANAERNER